MVAIPNCHPLRVPFKPRQVPCKPHTSHLTLKLYWLLAAKLDGWLPVDTSEPFKGKKKALNHLGWFCSSAQLIQAIQTSILRWQYYQLACLIVSFPRC